MGVRYRTVKDNLPKMQRAIQTIDGKFISVGAKGDMAWLAGIHEYGCRIRITDKMRKWLHANGLPVKKTTTEIIIPERSFLRAGFDLNHEDVVRQAERILPQVISGKLSEDVLYETIGLLLQDAIRDYIEDLRTPPKHPFTLKRNPNKTNPLIVSGAMRDSIEYEVVDE